MKNSIKTGLILALVMFSTNKAQNYLKYSVANAHSHNDYEQQIPFKQAYQAQFGSIEADVFLVKDQLLVAHTEQEINPEKSLEHLYLIPIAKQIQANKGRIYADANRQLQLLIDVKRDALLALDALVKLLKKYPEISSQSGLKIVITGGRPQAKDFKNYPEIISFDGDLDKIYTVDQLKRIALFSADFKELTNWNGKGTPRDEDKKMLKNTVDKAHALQKPIRFYAAPDFANA